jgi:sugar lactone lactonase YvrE
MWMDHCLKVYSAEGKEQKSLTFPAKCITCPSWGGPNNDVLFVTSAQPLGEKQEEDDEGGNVFKYEAGVKGMANYEFVDKSGSKL